MDLDEFSDNGFDDLPENALQELENNAILNFTQANVDEKVKYPQQPKQDDAPSQMLQQEYSDFGWDEDDDLDTSEVMTDAGVPVGRPPGSKSVLVHQRQLQQQQQQKQDVRSMPQPITSWGPTAGSAQRIGPDLTSRPRFHAGSMGVPPVPQAYPSQRPLASVAAPAPHFSQAQAPGLSQGPESLPSAPNANIISALQHRVRALESELNSARGEAYIIRSNASKAQQHHDEEIGRIKKLSAEQLARQERIAEAAVAAEKSASTELQFLQRDMREFRDRPPPARRRNGPVSGAGEGSVRAGAAGVETTATTTTPRKSARYGGFADGFDDLDMFFSPSKAQGRVRTAGSVAVGVGDRTPSKGKRKRAMADSPVLALETHESQEEIAAVPDQQPAGLRLFQQPSNAQAMLPTASPPFEFLQLILDHGDYPGQPPTFDLFSRFSFPSDPSTSFAALIFSRLPIMGNPHKPVQLLVDFSEFVIILWKRCFDEELWPPIKHLVSLLLFTFQLQTSSVASLVSLSLVPIASSTLRLLAERRHQLPQTDLAKDEVCAMLEQHIDTSSIMSLLKSCAACCAAETVETSWGFELRSVEYWRSVSVEFVLLLLTPKQKLNDNIAMLDLLSTSSLPDSIGPRGDDQEPAVIAHAVIERVSARLVEQPRGSLKTPAAEKRAVQTAALRTLIAFATQTFGLTQLAAHANVLPRLVTCLSISIDSLYDQPVPLHILPPLPGEDKASAQAMVEASPSAVLHQIISQCVNLIHLIVTDPRTANLANISQKLSAFRGADQRYLLALGRLTFAEEDLVLEAGIDGEVVEAAQDLIEMLVTPNEGEKIGEAFRGWSSGE